MSNPREAVQRLLSRLHPVEAEELPLSRCAGRVLAEPIVADRDSPPHDCTAMDGYAVRLADLGVQPLPVAGEIPIGTAPPAMVAGRAWRVFTGACVPDTAEAIVIREDVREHTDHIELTIDASDVKPGQHIRRRGENLTKGAAAVPAGRPISAAVAATLASFGHTSARVHRRLKVSLLVTGNEVYPTDHAPEPWQIRDANGPALEALLATLSTVSTPRRWSVSDHLEFITERLSAALLDSDVVLVTGGVSVGDHDHVPQAVEQAGAEIVFHHVDLRPGRPVLGAATPTGQAILGLPGNPVSVLMTVHGLGLPVLRHQAGFAEPFGRSALVRLRSSGKKRVPLWWYRAVRFVGDGEVELVPSRGSADFVSAANSDGYIVMPPNSNGAGPYPFHPWLT